MQAYHTSINLITDQFGCAIKPGQLYSQDRKLNPFGCMSAMIISQAVLQLKLRKQQTVSSELTCQSWG